MGGKSLPPTFWFDDCRKEGVEQGVLSERNSAEGLRSFVRSALSGE